jgi:hypothetical protein
MIAKKRKAKKKLSTEVRLKIDLTAPPGSVIPQGFRIHGDIPLTGKDRPTGLPLPHEFAQLILRSLGKLNVVVGE